jgi:hypothetical protein
MVSMGCFECMGSKSPWKRVVSKGVPDAARRCFQPGCGSPGSITVDTLLKTTYSSQAKMLALLAKAVRARAISSLTVLSVRMTKKQKREMWGFVTVVVVVVVLVCVVVVHV